MTCCLLQNKAEQLHEAMFMDKNTAHKEAIRGVHFLRCVLSLLTDRQTFMFNAVFDVAATHGLDV